MLCRWAARGRGGWMRQQCAYLGAMRRKFRTRAAPAVGPYGLVGNRPDGEADDGFREPEAVLAEGVRNAWAARGPPEARSQALGMHLGRACVDSGIFDHVPALQPAGQRNCSCRK